MDKDLMTKLGLLAGFIGLIMFAKIGYHQFKVKSLNNQGKQAALKFIKEQREHFEKNQEYIYDLNKISALKNLESAFMVYHDEETVEDAYKPIISAVGVPFLTRDDYRVYVGIKNHYDNKLYFWVVNANEDPELLQTDIQLDSVAMSN